MEYECKRRRFCWWQKLLWAFGIGALCVSLVAYILSVNVHTAIKVSDVDVEHAYVQLWEGGPYWATTNVGAEKPEDYGYYFWWGDTVGYKRNAANNGWVSVKDGKAFSFGIGSCPTFDWDDSELRSAGYIDSTGSLVAAYDAATQHWGAPWRMPTAAEFDALISNCTSTQATCNGVYGRLVTGIGNYASKSIFLPAAGYGRGSRLDRYGPYGYYRSSTKDSFAAWYLYFNSSSFRRDVEDRDRCEGMPVRPVREFAQ